MSAATDVIKFFLTVAAVAQAEKKERQQKQKQLNEALPFAHYEIVQPKISQYAENKNH